jgi:hypothetical protein
VPQSTPLATLLSWAWIAHTIEVDNAVEAAASKRVGALFRISLPMWANGLRLIDEGGTTVGEVRRRARAACNLGGLEQWGWIAIGDDPDTRRAGYGTRKGLTAETVLRPTRAGAYARRAWPRAVAAVAERWRERFGADLMDALLSELAPAAAGMPWSPPEVHPSDGFFTHVLAGDGPEGERPPAALLGQALTEVTIGLERDAPVSLPLAAGVLRAIGAESVPIRDLPVRTGLAREGIAMAVGYLQRRRLAAQEPGRAVVLTPRGLAALEAYRRRAAPGDRDGLRAALERLLAQRDALAAGLEPPHGCWRGERPHLARTLRLLDDPTAALPRQPMVLHRGGWPDAG